MACSAMQNFHDALVHNGYVQVGQNGLEVISPAMTILTLNKMIDGLKAKFPALNTLLNQKVYTITGKTLTFNQDMLDIIDIHLQANNAQMGAKANSVFGITASNDVIDTIIGTNPKWDNYIDLMEKRRKKYAQDVSRFSYLVDKETDPTLRAQYAKSLFQAQRMLAILDHRVNEIHRNPLGHKMLLFAEDDFKRVRGMMSQATTAEQFQELEDILKFYQNMTSLDSGNFIFDIEGLRDSSGKLNAQGRDLLDQFLSPIATQAEELLSELEVRRKEIAMAVMAENTQVQKFFEDQDIPFDELIFYKEGLADTALIDAWIMDAGSGITSQNGLIPQIMRLELERAMGANDKYVQDLEKELNPIIDKVMAVLRTNPVKIEGKSNPMWDIFFAHKNGLKQDAIITVYTQTYHRAVDKANNRYKFHMSEAAKIADPSIRQLQEQRIEQDYLDEMNRLSERVNFNLIPELLPDNAAQSQKDAAEKFKDMLIDRMGQYSYDLMVKEAKKKKANYEEQYDLLLQFHLAAEGVNDYHSLSSQAKSEIKAFEDSSVGPNATSHVYTVRVARDVDANGVNTGFYDETFKEIEKHPELMEFYDILRRNQEQIKNLLPADKQAELGSLSMMSMRKGFWEIFGDSNMTFLQKLAKVMAHIKEYIISNFMQDAYKIRRTMVDPITGKRNYQVSDRFFRTNSSEIRSRTEDLMIELARLNNINIADLKNSNYRIKGLNLSNTHLRRILSDLLGTMPTEAAIEAKLGYKVGGLNVYNAVKDAVEHSVMSEQSVDLPRMMKIQLYQAAMYNAKNNMLPTLSMMRSYYDEIRTGTGGVRHNAMKQMDSWFNRVVLDNYEDPFDATLDESELGTPDALGEFVNDRGRQYLSKEDKAKYEHLERVKKTLEDEIAKTKDVSDKEWLERKKSQVETRMKMTGRYMTARSFFTGILNFLRVKVLGWNFGSNIINYVEGQVSNRTWAERGIYFNMDELMRAKAVVDGSFVNGFVKKGKGKGFRGANKAKFIMNLYDVQMDASNELQRSTNESKFNRAKNLNPWMITQRTEYMNQAPVIVAIMMHKKVTGENGKVSTLWDAINEDGSIKPEFDTQEVRDLIENIDSPKFQEMKALMGQAIVNIHGDYSETRGNMMTEYVWGKAVMMFKRWMGKYAEGLFAPEHIDLATGKKLKGRFRNATLGTIVVGSALSGIALGPVSMLATAAFGGYMVYSFGLQSHIGFAQDLLQNIKNLAIGMMRMGMTSLPFRHLGLSPVNYDFSSYEKAGLDEAAINDMKANLTHMSLISWFIIIHFAAKAMAAGFFSDDDDEDKDKDRGFWIYMANKAAQLFEQNNMWLSPTAMAKNTMGEISILQWANDWSKLLEAANSGPLTQNTFNKAKKVFLPSPLRSGWLGLEAQSERIFFKSAYDSMLQSDSDKAKSEFKEMRKEYLDKIREQGDYTDEEWEKAKRKISRKIGKRKTESNDAYRDRLNKELDKIRAKEK